MKVTVDQKLNSKLKKIEKNSDVMKRMETIVNTTENAILQWDRLMSKSNIFNRNHRNPGEVTSDTSISVRIAQKLRKEIEDEKKSKKFLEKDVHDMKVKINSLKAETIEKVVSKNKKINHQIALKVSSSRPRATTISNVKSPSTAASSSEQLESLKSELEKTNITVEELKEQLRTAALELSNEKGNNITLMNSYTAALNKHKNLELELIAKTQERLAYEDKLNRAAEALEIVRNEKNDFQKRLEESEQKLTNMDEKLNSLTKESERDLNELAERLQEIEEERYEWNEYQIELEKQISDDQNALMRKEQCIKEQDALIDELTQEKNDLETRLNELIVSESCKSEEMEKYRHQMSKLADVVADMKNTFAVTEASYKKEKSEMHNKFEEQEKSIATKDEIIDKQNTLLRLMKQRTPETGDQIDKEKFFKYKQQIMKYFKDINFF